MSTRPRHNKADRLATDNTAGYMSFDDSPEFDEADKKAGHIAGDPWNETQVLVTLQDALFDAPGVLPTARALSLFGEHSLGWIAVAILGSAIDNKHRECWIGTAGVTFAAHAAGVGIKRVVRRLRPHGKDVRIGVATPSKLSFPSSHCTSTTTALICISALTKKPILLTGIPVMALSRMLLGVHYPSDVIAGTALGATVAGLTKKFTCPC